MNNTQKLLQLAAENPDLPIVPMVYYDDVVGEGCGYWLCEFGDCYVGEYALYNDRYYEDRDELKDDYYCSNVEDFEGYTNDDELEKALDLATDHMWTKAIIVYINA
jgi:hypothetical protein